MRMSIEEAFVGGNTDPRNESILKIFNLIKIGERAGTGIQTILHAAKINGFKTPIMEETFKRDRTTLTIFLEPINLNRINNKKTDTLDSKDEDALSIDEENTLKYLRSDQALSR